MCESVVHDTMTAMVPLDVELPCPNCHYDLRGLDAGPCPECGATFRAEELEPEAPGLALENWFGSANSAWGRAALPLRIGLSPVRAFRRKCRIETVLTTSPLQTAVWFLIWYVSLLFVFEGSVWASARIRGRELVLFPSGFSALPVGDRFGFVALAPFNLVVAWLECLSVVLIAVAIAWRALTLKQILRLATWTLCFALAAGVFAIVYGVAWDFALAELNERLDRVEGELSGYCSHLRPLLNLRFRGPDLALGLLAGLATGTVLQRRQWVIALVSGATLVAVFPIRLSLDVGFRQFVYEPARVALFGSRIPGPGYDLLQGPTFRAGSADPSMTGVWEVWHDGAAENSPPIMMTFDDTGRLVRLGQRQKDSGRWVEYTLDGQWHEAPGPKGAQINADVGYRGFGACRREGSEVTIETRLELSIVATSRDGTISVVPYADEEQLLGHVADDQTRIAGRSFRANEAPGFRPNHREGSFVMRRPSTSSSPASTPAIGPFPEN